MIRSLSVEEEVPLEPVPDDREEELVGLMEDTTPNTPTSEASYGGARSRTPSSSSIPVPTNSYRSRTPSSSSIPVPITLRTRTPTTGSAIQRSGSGLSDNRRTSKTTTSYGADGSRITQTTSTYSSTYDSSGQQSSRQNW